MFDSAQTPGKRARPLLRPSVEQSDYCNYRAYLYRRCVVACLEEGPEDEQRGDKHGKAARREHDDPIPTGRLYALELQNVGECTEPRIADLHRQHQYSDSGRLCKRHTHTLVYYIRTSLRASQTRTSIKMINVSPHTQGMTTRINRLAASCLCSYCIARGRHAMSMSTVSSDG